MPEMLRFLVAESETEENRAKRRESTGRSSGESYVATLRLIVPDAFCEIIQPVESDGRNRADIALSDYDAVFLTGSPLHVYRESLAVRRQLEFMRAVFDSGTPSFGSCAGLQVAVAAAGGTVRENKRGHEVAFARRIVPTEAGRSHPLLAGRPAAYDACTIHSDEVETLPPRATLLATNGVTKVQAAEVRIGDGVFWGVQYHPELPLCEIADALRRQAKDIVEQGLARDAQDVESYAAAIEALGGDPAREDLAWRLGVDRQVTVRCSVRPSCATSSNASSAQHGPSAAGHSLSQAHVLIETAVIATMDGTEPFSIERDQQNGGLHCKSPIRVREGKMAFMDVLLGRRLVSRDLGSRKIGWFEAVPAMGLDGLGSVSYGPEAA